jgi:hypothetical protein
MARRLIWEIEAKRAVENAIPRAFPIVAKDCPFTASWYTGMTVSLLRTLVRNGSIPAQTQGVRTIIMREDLDSYLTRSKRTNRYAATETKSHPRSARLRRVQSGR